MKTEKTSKHEDVVISYKKWLAIQKSLDSIETHLKSIGEKGEFMHAGLREAQELFETVRASHDWTEKKNAWLDKYVGKYE